MNIAPKFGTTYKFYDSGEAIQKKAELAGQNIPSAIEERSSDDCGNKKQSLEELLRNGPGANASIMNWVVHTDENGTKDLTDFRNSGKAEFTA